MAAVGEHDVDSAVAQAVRAREHKPVRDHEPRTGAPPPAEADDRRSMALEHRLERALDLDERVTINLHVARISATPSRRAGRRPSRRPLRFVHARPRRDDRAGPGARDRRRPLEPARRGGPARRPAPVRRAPGHGGRHRAQRADPAPAPPRAPRPPHRSALLAAAAALRLRAERRGARAGRPGADAGRLGSGARARRRGASPRRLRDRDGAALVVPGLRGPGGQRGARRTRPRRRASLRLKRRGRPLRRQSSRAPSVGHRDLDRPRRFAEPDDDRPRPLPGLGRARARARARVHGRRLRRVPDRWPDHRAGPGWPGALARPPPPPPGRVLDRARGGRRDAGGRRPAMAPPRPAARARGAQGAGRRALELGHGGDDHGRRTADRVPLLRRHRRGGGGGCRRAADDPAARRLQRVLHPAAARDRRHADLRRRPRAAHALGHARVPPPALAGPAGLGRRARRPVRGRPRGDRAAREPPHALRAPHARPAPPPPAPRSVGAPEAARRPPAEHKIAAMAITLPETERFDAGAMAQLLDGRYGEVRARVRELLCREEFAPVVALPTPEYRERVLRWARAMARELMTAPGFPPEYGGLGDAGANVAAFETLGCGGLSLLVTFGVQFGLWGGAVQQLGTRRHHEAYLRRIASLELPGCFAMTEAGHGSDVQHLRTTATYDPAAGEFVIHTPEDEARKEYIGNAACHGQMAAVFAQLIVDGEEHGVHAFVVPLRREDG